MLTLISVYHHLHTSAKRSAAQLVKSMLMAMFTDGDMWAGVDVWEADALHRLEKIHNAQGAQNLDADISHTRLTNRQSFLLAIAI